MHRETRTANQLLVFLMGVSILILSLPLSRPVASIKACLAYMFDPSLYQGAIGVNHLSEIPSSARDLISADAQNKILKEEIKNELLLRTKVDSLESENARLREEMGLVVPGGKPFIWASVIKRAPADWYRSLLVSAGENQGLKLNDPVFAPHEKSLAAVGRVVEVRANISVVQLLTNDLSAVAALVVSGSTQSASSFGGLAQGEGLPSLRLNYLPIEAPLREGDRVVTSPTSVSFPPSVLIGTVLHLYPVDPFLIFQSAEIRPALAPSSFDEVLIMINDKGIKELQ
jgi:rod shape-determining protein MreC